ncbi:hypothetical protein AB6884_13035 [Carnobacterium maltaromaticum]|uniref:hypothetical protein n=1 Tax=Carnobacterium maltaromaticum TaxID=2751 RepID=UPI0039BE9795
MLILEINGLTEDELQEELTGFFQILNEKYSGYGATVTGVTNSAATEIKELIK